MDRYPIPHPTVLKDILRQKKPSAPLTAMIHITEHCNVRCEFCWHHSYFRPKPLRPQRMETSTVLSLIHQLAQMGTTDVTLSANGEPTIHPGFTQIIKTLKETGIKIKIITNLSLLSPSIAAALAQTNLLVVNLAAVDEESYQSIYAPRGNTTFSDVLKNIKILSKLQAHRGPEIKLGFVITRNTYHHIESLVNLAEEIQIASIRFKFMDPSSFTHHLILNDNDRQWLINKIPLILKKQKKVAHNLNDILQQLSPNLTKKKSSYKTIEHPRCFIGWLVININENGTVTLCCQNDQLIIGNWKEKSLREIWEGQKAQEFRESTKTRINFNNPLFHACRGCHYSNPQHYTRRINHA